MSDRAWAADLRCLGMLLRGDAIDECDERGRHIEGSTLLVLFNAQPGVAMFILPDLDPGEGWELVLDTAVARPDDANWASGSAYSLEGRSVSVLHKVARPDRHPRPLGRVASRPSGAAATKGVHDGH
jgi:glycogen operon protein